MLDQPKGSLGPGAGPPHLEDDPQNKQNKAKSRENKAIAISRVLSLEKMWKCEKCEKIVKTCEKCEKLVKTCENLWKLVKTCSKLNKTLF